MFISLWRTLVLFITVSLTLRFMGKRQIGELQPGELATTIMISNIAAIPIENTSSPMINGLASITLLACLEVLLSCATLKYRGLRGLALGHPRCVIRDGNIDQQELRRLRWSLDDLMELLRGNGIFNVDEVLFAIVETNGSLSAYPKHKYRTTTNEGMAVPLSGSEAPPAIIISDGKVDPAALTFCNLDDAWLQKTLTRQGLRPQDVFLMSCDRAAQYRIVKKAKPGERPDVLKQKGEPA